MSFSTEELAGPAYVYAIATAPKPAYLGCAELPVSEKRNPASIRSAALSALQNLQNKLPKDSEISTYLSDDPFFRDLMVSELLRTFYVPSDSAPKDIAAAKTFARRHLRARLEALALEYPMLPWERRKAVEDADTDVVPFGFSQELIKHLEVLQHFGPLGLYDVTHPDLAPAWAEITRKKKILLHICCGPDAAGVINQLKRDFEVVCFWYDPNIQPKEEHDKRFDAFVKVAEIEDVPYIVGEYDVQTFFKRIRGLEHTPEQGAKCSQCYDLRLERAALEAIEQKCDLYATTLAISPHKVQEKLKSFGELNFKKYGVPYYHRNFMKDDGFKRSVELTEEYGIYRQDYCGCLFSLHEGGPDARAKAQELGLTKDAMIPGLKNPFERNNE